MPSIITNKLKELNISNIINTVENENVFVSFGKIDSWTNENSPEIPIDNYNLGLNFFTDQIYMKRVVSGNISRVAKYYRWIPNTRYQQYSSTENIETLCEPKLYAPATAEAVVQSGSIAQINVTYEGSGYDSAPSVTISGGGGTGATATAIISEGAVVSIVVTSGGSGFTSTPTVTIAAPKPSISSSAFTVNPYYVVTDDLNVYICTNNNNLALSTVKPTSTNTNEDDSGGTTLADGYKWKYVYTITQNDAEKFMTSNWIPVKNLSEDDSTNNWLIQYNSTENNRIHGSDIPYALNASALMVKVRVSGDEGGKIITTNDYRKISLILNPVATKSIYKAAGGGTNTITLNASHDVSDTNALWYPTVGKKIKILEGPGRGQIREIVSYNAGTKTVTVDENWTYSVTTDSTYGILLSTQVSNLCTILTLTSVSGTFIEDEVATQSGSGASGKIAWFDSTNNKLYLANVSGTFTTGQPVSQGAATGTVSAITNPDADPYPVDVLFTENRKKIIRYLDQIEDVKIIIQF